MRSLYSCHQACSTVESGFQGVALVNSLRPCQVFRARPPPVTSTAPCCAFRSLCAACTAATSPAAQDKLHIMCTARTASPMPSPVSRSPPPRVTMPQLLEQPFRLFREPGPLLSPTAPCCALRCSCADCTAATRPAVQQRVDPKGEVTW
jgi:hypothetical protein